MALSKELKFKLTVFIVLVAFLTVVFLYRSYTEEIDLGEKTVSIIVKPGSSFGQVTSQLLQEKVIYSKLMFKIPARLYGIDKKLVPGRYDFSGKNSCRSVLARLEDGDFLRIKVTIPEGNTIWETAALLAEKLELDSAIIHNLDSDSLFLKEKKIKGLEGYLFPETYYFPWGVDERTVVSEMIAMYRTMTDSLWNTAAENDLSPYEVIIMASIIEAETGMVDERKLVSSVYHNRLKKKMKLDADPTVIYGLGGLTRPLYTKDLKKDSPYNTYMRRGLTPTPINSPGLASIQAAIAPETTDFFYFVADTNGQHYFSKTNAEHNRAVQRIRANRR